MPSVNFYFQVHQPYRLKKYRIFDIGQDHNYFEGKINTDWDNQKIFRKVAEKSYLPTNKLLLELLNQHPEFKISFSFSGIFLDQAQDYYPEVLESFKDLVNTGRAEVLAETYYHSLAFLYSKREFEYQVKKHSALVKKIFKVTPKVFRNTELIYNNDLATAIEKLGYKGIITEGADRILDWRSPNFVYRPKGTQKIGLLLKNYQLSDDIAFRFGNQGWQEHPLSSEKFASWVNDINGNGNLVNLFMDFETFGEHQWEDTGIFEFMRHLPAKVLANPDNNFVTPSEAVEKYSAVSELDIPEFVSWADSERDLSAWRSNQMQWDSFAKIYDLEEKVLATKQPQLIEDWRRMQTSDHFYYMCTKYFNDGDVHKYFSPYQSPYEAFIYYMNVLQDLKLRVGA